MALADDIRTKVQESVTAQEAGDYTTALSKLRSARILMAGLPKRSKHGENELEFDQAAIDGMIDHLTRLEATAKGVKVTKVTYAQPAPTDTT